MTSNSFGACKSTTAGTFKLPDILGKRVEVRSGAQVLLGQIKKEVDWLVGCPVFVSDTDGKMLGVGYECTVVSVLPERKP